MEAQDALRAISISSPEPRTVDPGSPAPAPSKRVNSEKPAPEQGSADAVHVRLSAEAVKAERQPKSREVKAEAPDVVSNTVVRFDLSAAAEQKPGLQFKVVDRVSGDVVREFPPDYTPDQQVEPQAAKHVKVEA